jgi:hypothetical protein
MAFNPVWLLGGAWCSEIGISSFFVRLIKGIIPVNVSQTQKHILLAKTCKSK